MTGTVEPTLETLSDRARGLLQGAIDIHVHADPDPYAKRKADFAATAMLLPEAGAGVMLLREKLETVREEREERRARLRAEGRANERRLWEAWYERFDAARTRGEPFDEPPPPPED